MRCRLTIPPSGIDINGRVILRLVPSRLRRRQASAADEARQHRLRIDGDACLRTGASGSGVRFETAAQDDG
jgi:hypothetical protein